MKVLITCPPMLGMIDHFRPIFTQKNIEITTPEVIQTLSIQELCELLPQHDGWIIGDDPANLQVFKAGKAGKLKAAVKWGVGVDNVDFKACESLELPITNTPNMFGKEVADVAFSYVVALARQTFEIDRGVREGNWPKPVGISLAGKTAAVVGYGDVGINIAIRLKAADMHINVYDPCIKEITDASFSLYNWPQKINQADFIILACGLTDSSYHLINQQTLELTKQHVRIINVARGALIDEAALIDALIADKVHSVALDVFEQEPLPTNSKLRSIQRCVFGSHNASNTSDAVIKTSLKAIQKLFAFLDV